MERTLTLPGWTPLYSGKVRDLFIRTDEPERVLVVASDRVSAYDHILPTLIPDKGRILTALSLWWFDRLSGISVDGRPLRHHVVSTDVPAEVAGRAMICRRLQMVPVECVARGYLTGSGLSDYTRTGQVCGVPLPPGLLDGSRLPNPIFTPATKAAVGDHDENVSYDRVVDRVGADLAQALRSTTLQVYRAAEATTRAAGVILADTKLEFGVDQHWVDQHWVDRHALILADEVLTPDSSRFWPAEQWQPGRPQPSFDKQFVRDWLTSPEADWDRHATQPPPPLPEAVVERTRERYLQAYHRITGSPWR